MTGVVMLDVAPLVALIPPPPPLEQAAEKAQHSAASTMIFEESVLRIKPLKSDRKKTATMLSNITLLVGGPRPTQIEPARPAKTAGRQ